MIERIQNLNNKYLDIKNLKWVKTVKNGTSGVGRTFETLLGKCEENFPIPDYDGIEIKTSHRNSWGNIHLLHLTPDGDYLFPILRIIDLLGYPDNDFPQYKVFNYSLTAKKYTMIKNGIMAKIYVDREKEKVYVLAKDKYNNNLNVNVSWSFDELEARINLKLKYLAIIKASTKWHHGIEYFFYNQANYYKIKDFNTFIDLIEKGVIRVTFMIGLHKSGKRLGQTHDRGTTFTINDKYINELYERIDIYNTF